LVVHHVVVASAGVEYDVIVVVIVHALTEQEEVVDATDDAVIGDDADVDVEAVNGV